MESVVSTSALYNKKQHPTTSGGSTVQFSGKTSASTIPNTTTTTTTAATTHPKSILRQTTVLSNADSERNDGSLSDTALGGPGISSIHNKNANGGMGQKSSSTSQLSDTGRQRRLGLIGAKRTRITVHRLEEKIFRKYVENIYTCPQVGGGDPLQHQRGQEAHQTRDLRLQRRRHGHLPHRANRRRKLVDDNKQRKSIVRVHRRYIKNNFLS